MPTLNFKEYKNYIENLGGGSRYTEKDWNYWYKIYTTHEKAWWLDYFENIFLKNFKIDEPISLYFWESGPPIKRGAKAPNPNYAFYNLKDPIGKKTGYLAKVCGREDIFTKDSIIITPKKQVNEQSSKRKALSCLSKEKNVLIIDLQGTHGLDCGRFRNEFVKTFKLYSKPKLEKIIEKLETAIRKRGGKQVRINRDVSYVPFLNDQSSAKKRFLSQNEGGIKNALRIKGHINWLPYSKAELRDNLK